MITMKLNELEQNAGYMIMIYGQPGSGKTSAIRNLRGKTLTIDIENGYEVLHKYKMKDLTVCPVGKSIDEIMEAVHSDLSPYDNIVIDNLSSMYYSMLGHKAKAGKNQGAPELAHYNQANFQLLAIVQHLRTWCTDGKNIIINGWLNLIEIEDKLTMEKSYKYTMDVGKIHEKILGEASIVGKIIMPKGKKRYIQTLGTDNLIAKDRLFGHAYYPVDIQAILDGKGQGITTEQKQETQ